MVALLCLLQKAVGDLEIVCDFFGLFVTSIEISYNNTNFFHTETTKNIYINSLVPFNGNISQKNNLISEVNFELIRLDLPRINSALEWTLCPFNTKRQV